MPTYITVTTVTTASTGAELTTYISTMTANGQTSTVTWYVPSDNTAVEDLYAARADSRAEQLLWKSLGRVQRKELRADGWFTVTAPSGRRYRITDGIVRNVFRLDASGVRVEQLCAYPPDVPIADARLAQKLMIETDELGFRQIANITRLGRLAA